jgi:NAD(P)-dependent dehydrogenase (short-subunit alcohol dehydrogenase family)
MVMAVAPGWIETDRTRPVLATPAGAERRQQSPLNRVGQPEEVTQTILFLASGQSDFLTGAIVDINGASYLRS